MFPESVVNTGAAGDGEVSDSHVHLLDGHRIFPESVVNTGAAGDGEV
jgi:hypothetical protein